MHEKWDKGANIKTFYFWQINQHIPDLSVIKMMHTVNFALLQNFSNLFFMTHIFGVRIWVLDGW